MFNVIICDEKIINDCKNKYKMLLNPLFNDEKFAFCRWDKNGDTLDTALPDLENIIYSVPRWRAYIIIDSEIAGFSRINKINPFDYVEFKRSDYNFNSIEQIKKYRCDKDSAYEKALENPLTRLLFWLSEPSTVCPLDIDKSIYEHSQSLPDDYFNALERKELRADKIEFQLSYNKRIEVINKNYSKDSVVEPRPSQIICIAERLNAFDEEISSNYWRKHYENEYSDFADCNLYPDKLRYLIFESTYYRGKRSDFNYINFLVCLLILAANEFPIYSVRAGRVYRIYYENDRTFISRVFGRYEAKLNKTAETISENINYIVNKPKKIPIYNETEQIFASGANIRVKNSNKINKGDLFYRYGKIGLTRDCPEDEYYHLENQNSITQRRLKQYSRVPEDALERTVNDNFRNNNFIDSKQLAQYENYRIKDFQNKIADEEKMILDPVLPNISDTARFEKNLDALDNKIKKSIKKRMNRKTATTLGLIVLLIYFLCFLPMFITNRGTLQSIVSSMLLTLISVGIIAVGGGASLISLRQKHIEKIEMYNKEVRNIVDEIDGSMEKYSEYLSHLSNIMRANSVINYIKDKSKRTKKEVKIMKRHIYDIRKLQEECERTFGEYIDERDKRVAADPYEYNFLNNISYEYPVPYDTDTEKIIIISEDNIAESPVGLIKRILVVREELYD